MGGTKKGEERRGKREGRRKTEEKPATSNLKPATVYFRIKPHARGGHPEA
jgi:hypothetical protein